MGAELGQHAFEARLGLLLLGQRIKASRGSRSRKRLAVLTALYVLERLNCSCPP